MDDVTHLPPLDAERLRAPVGLVLADVEVEVADWQVTSLTGGLGFLAGLYRVTGRAHRHGALVPWSLILKIALPPPVGAGLPDGSALPATANWRREFLIYDSGLLRSLPPGLHAPQCHGSEDRAALGLWLWLEDLGELGERSWSAERLGRVARHLGTFSGAYLVGQTLPTAVIATTPIRLRPTHEMRAPRSRSLVRWIAPAGGLT